MSLEKESPIIRLIRKVAHHFTPIKVSPEGQVTRMYRVEGTTDDGKPFAKDVIYYIKRNGREGQVEYTARSFKEKKK